MSALEKRIRKSTVEEASYAITTTRLKRFGLLRPGQRCEIGVSTMHGKETWITDLTTGEPFFAVLYSNCAQFIRLVAKMVGQGQRWYFREGAAGIQCTKVYFHEGRYVSRRTAGLKYESQRLSKGDRLKVKARKAEDVIIGAFKGPARGASRERKLSVLKEVRRELRKVSEDLQRTIDQKDPRWLRELRAEQKLLNAKDRRAWAQSRKATIKGFV